ncbi:hypothetical protein B0T19DRAFT_452287 [Cercophora scortea]|uniref:Uncharacterized protein n=1 Tax=Cercophora scortea TaxID=314031 RepID=A0AAE0MKD0_9PEZI|nr:hypothetical protein B0T19DRAFT_452287 [Cercophora scortea]
MARTYFILHRKWRVKWPMYWGMIPELLGVIAMLVLFGLQQPDVFRSQFWAIGYQEGFNSNPNMILYAYANHRPLPDIPFVWSQTLTNFNVAISVVSLFSLLSKMIATIMKVYYPIIGLVANLGLTAIYTVSVYGQAGPDYADPKHPSPVAWYIRMSCDVAKPYNAVGNCQMAKASFAVTVLMMILYATYLGLSIWAMLPNPELDIEDEDDEFSVPGGRSSPSGDDKWEMQPTTPGRGPMSVPFTPRTQAFHTLDRKLPLRGGAYA